MTKDEMRIERMLRFTTKAQYRSIATPKKQHTSRQKVYKYIKQELWFFAKEREANPVLYVYCRDGVFEGGTRHVQAPRSAKQHDRAA